MIVSLIAAVAKNGAIGKNNDLPWHLPDDMKYFMQTTKGHHVVMGRKNYESLPHKYRPLPHRINYVVTRQANFSAPGCVVVNSIEDALQLIRKDNPEEIFVIGGGEIYQLALPYAHRLYLTEIDAEISGDTYFPAFTASEWYPHSRQHHAADARHAYAFDFVVYQRKN